jgi:hypothetical protein
MDRCLEDLKNYVDGSQPLTWVIGWLDRLRLTWIVG